MKLRAVLTISLLLVMIVAAGCGPTKAGKEAREDARARLGSFKSQFTYDQAKQDFEAGQFDRAMRAIDKAIEQAPDEGKYWLLRGRIFIEIHRLERAIESLEMALEKDAELADAHYYAGFVYERWADDEQALEHYRQAFELESDQVHYLMATAESLIALGELEAARTLVESKLVYFENNATMQHLLGQIALLQGDPATAARRYTEARLLAPDNLTLIEDLAWAQYDAEQYGSCLESLRTLNEKQAEERADLLQLEARCLTMLGRPSEAHGLYMRLTSLSPSDTSGWIEFGTIAWELKDFRRVAQCGVKAVALAPMRFEGYMLKGLHERHNGRLDAAAALFRQAADLADDTVMPHLLLGRTLEETGNPRAALNVYAEAVRLDPASPDAVALYGRLEREMRLAVADDEGRD